MIAKDTYKTLSQNHLPIWCQDWYLDAVCGDAWDCRAKVKSEQVLAVWVFGYRQRWGLRSINFPTFLKYNGVFFAETLTDAEAESYAMECVKELPRTVRMSIEFIPGIQGRIPGVIELFRKRAFAQKERTTYIWDVRPIHEELIQKMDGNYRRMIAKRREECRLQYEDRMSARELWDFHGEWVGDLREHGVKKGDFLKLVDALYDRDAGEVISLYKGEDRVSSVLLLRDKEVVYYLLSVNNKTFNKLYPSVLMAERVAAYASEKGVQYIDFLGSDIDSISRVWRKLGATKHSYLFMNKSFKLPFN